VRGEVYRFTPPRGAKGHGQRGDRYAVVVQSDLLPLSTWIVCLTSTTAQPSTFRPEVDFGAGPTLVLTDQMMAISPERLGERVGTLTYAHLRAVDHALRVMLDLGAP
jgi:mRNA interferase MazF